MTKKNSQHIVRIQVRLRYDEKWLTIVQVNYQI